jgi:two-component system OmpR family response regulator
MNNKLQHVLIIDDEDDILEVAQMCLETVGGLQVTALNSGVEAIAKAQSINPDLILLDVMMPKMDGPETLKSLRQNAALNDVPIVFMTARVQPVEIEQYMQLGASGVVAKPFDPMTLSVQITEIWEKLHAK